MIINQRKCLICRCHFDKKQLVRLCSSKTGSKITIDDTKTLKGRGYYICFNPQHKKALLQYKVLNKAFRTYIDPANYDKIIEYLESYWNQALKNNK